ncbi:hypothetical protein WN48_01316 [Eufriesea mexicana]|uniref:Uncharacterized protein n=1 Tax=Eufriesea mexicana TaxID=516756 RepID=A0A310SL58_9HYME|nr:hypothetical protein WN48_01316 [Eufriesea mexicana]
MSCKQRLIPFPRVTHCACDTKNLNHFVSNIVGASRSVLSFAALGRNDSTWTDPAVLTTARAVAGYIVGPSQDFSWAIRFARSCQKAAEIKDTPDKKPRNLAEGAGEKFQRLRRRGHKSKYERNDFLFSVLLFIVDDSKRNQPGTAQEKRATGVMAESRVNSKAAEEVVARENYKEARELRSSHKFLKTDVTHMWSEDSVNDFYTAH